MTPPERLQDVTLAERLLAGANACTAHRMPGTAALLREAAAALSVRGDVGARLQTAVAEMRRWEADLRQDGMNAHANTYEHCAGIVSDAISFSPPSQAVADKLRELQGLPLKWRKMIDNRRGGIHQIRHNINSARAAELDEILAVVMPAIATPPSEG